MSSVGRLSFAQSLTESDVSNNFYLRGTALSFAGAFRALAEGTDAIVYNPAGLTRYRGQVIAAGDYAWAGRTSSQAFAVSMVDFRALEDLAVGLSYDRDNPSMGGSRVTVQQITLALGYPVSPQLSIGSALKGYFTDPGLPDGVDVDLGVLFQPLPMVSLALTAHNLGKGNDFEEFPFMLGMGMALILPPHGRFSVDLVRDFQTPSPDKMNAHFGGEITLAEGFLLRGGFGLDRVRANNFYSTGLALKGPKITLLFAFSQRLNPTTETYATHVSFFF